MSANPSRRERWPIPKQTRHVWVLAERRYEPPQQGYVIAWRRRSYVWHALVVVVNGTVEGSDQGWTETRQWYPSSRLLAVRSVPEDIIERAPLERHLRRHEH